MKPAGEPADPGSNLTMRQYARMRLLVIALSIFSSSLLAFTAVLIHRGSGGDGEAAMSPDGTESGQTPTVVVKSQESPAAPWGSYKVVEARGLFKGEDAPPRPQETATITSNSPAPAPERPQAVVNSGGDSISLTGIVRLRGIRHILMKNNRTGESRYVPFGESAWGYLVKEFDGESVTLEKDGREFRVPIGTSHQDQPTGRARAFDFGAMSAGLGPGLTSMGGSIVNGVYTFDPGQGLQFEQENLADDYVVELTFKLDQTEGFRKIIDFKGLTSDSGLYVYNGQLHFYGSDGAGGSIEPGQEYQVRLERDRNTQTVRAFVNGEQAFEFDDAKSEAVFDGGKAALFVDDRSGGEQSGGSARRIKIWNR